MNLDDARAALLLRAVETRPPAEAAGPPAWTEADTAWSADEARRHDGAGGDAEALLRTRTRLAHARLAQRDAQWPAQLAAPLAGPWQAAAWGLPLAGLALGLAGDALAGARRIDLLAPPLLLLMAWNLAVYALLLASTLRRPATARLQGVAGWVVARATRLAQRGAPADAWRLRWQADCARAGAPVLAARSAGLLHLGAATLALGLLAGLYARGLVLDYRAGWDSTFLDAAQVRAVVGAVLGPAAALLGRPLPDAAALAALRWSDGGPGAPAAGWIHLYALTVLGVVVLPRLALAAWAAHQARRGARQVPLATLLAGDPWWQAQQAAVAGPPARRVTVLAYSHRPTPDQAQALPAALAQALGPGLALAAPLRSVPMGAEDDVRPLLDAIARPDGGDAVVLLYTLSATPERETHGAFATAVAKALPRGTGLHLAVDTAGYRQRLGTLPEAAARLQQRREAWQALCAALGLPAPCFIDLGAA